MTVDIVPIIVGGFATIGAIVSYYFYGKLLKKIEVAKANRPDIPKEKFDIIQNAAKRIRCLTILMGICGIGIAVGFQFL